MPEMRRIVVVILVIALSGCTKEPPPMAGEKWAAALSDPNVRVRKKAAFTLGNIGPSDPAVLPALIGALKDLDAGVRREAILALLKCGPAAKEAAEELRQLRHHDPDARVRTYAAEALEKLEK
jgi:HEAT repeat protein